MSPKNETGSAQERTNLAAERTELAWSRTALTALAVAIGVGRFGPELSTQGAEWPYIAIGIGFSLYAIACFIRGRTSNPTPPGQRRGTIDIFLGLGAIVLSVAVIALILFR